MPIIKQVNVIDHDDGYLDCQFIVTETKAALIDLGDLQAAERLNMVYLYVQSVYKQILQYEDLFQELYDRRAIPKVPSRYTGKNDLFGDKKKKR